LPAAASKQTHFDSLFSTMRRAVFRWQWRGSAVMILPSSAGGFSSKFTHPLPRLGGDNQPPPAPPPNNGADPEFVALNDVNIEINQ
jgi:hypothetical protein